MCISQSEAFTYEAEGASIAGLVLAIGAGAGGGAGAGCL